MNAPDTPSADAALDGWLERLEVLHPKKIDMSLERVERVVSALDLVEPPYRVLTVGGTNGKGSCVAYLETMYRQAGYRVAAYTSPHLWRFNERIRLGGVEATSADIIAAFEAIDRARGMTTLSYFEYATVAACWLFAERGVDIAVLEVGLGGRLDAVNALDADLALIASVDLDHQHWLGDTREAIGHEKAGIMRAARPAVVADRQVPASVLAHAAAIGAQLRRLGRDFDLTRHADGSWDYRGVDAALASLPRPALPGEIQYDNAAACCAAIEALGTDLPVSRDAVAAALASVELPGRLQRVPLGGVEWLFDVAHNPAAALRLAEELRRSPVPGRTLAVVGLMADKDRRGVIGPLEGLVDLWLVTRAATERACAPAALLDTLAELGCAPAREVPLADARALAAAAAEPGDRVVVFGSFQVVGPVMAAL
ncbi:MAG TPA: bifunctional tetrahydrofolate synthase/dihydrofolate synthase [Gammaproteobacteria bacterium]|nr:bifunctional tetrahydrofolate synthase/dihydrofolate synthase [Gammaproteobacteria bacterium]